jgi:hypothetical protein
MLKKDANLKRLAGKAHFYCANQPDLLFTFYFLFTYISFRLDYDNRYALILTTILYYSSSRSTLEIPLELKMCIAQVGSDSTMSYS